MPWQIVERKIGRAGSAKQRAARSENGTSVMGRDSWAVGYVIEGEFVLQEEALQSVYYRSYEAHFRAHPEDLEELLRAGSRARNPHAEATTGVDLQIPAIMQYLQRQRTRNSGQRVVDYRHLAGQRSHPISVRLSRCRFAACSTRS